MSPDPQRDDKANAREAANKHLEEEEAKKAKDAAERAEKMAAEMKEYNTKREAVEKTVDKTRGGEPPASRAVLGVRTNGVGLVGSVRCPG